MMTTNLNMRNDIIEQCTCKVITETRKKHPLHAH